MNKQHWHARSLRASARNSGGSRNSAEILVNLTGTWFRFNVEVPVIFFPWNRTYFPRRTNKLTADSCEASKEAVLGLIWGRRIHSSTLRSIFRMADREWHLNRSEMWHEKMTGSSRSFFGIPWDSGGAESKGWEANRNLKRNLQPSFYVCDFNGCKQN